MESKDMVIGKVRDSIRLLKLETVNNDIGELTKRSRKVTKQWQDSITVQHRYFRAEVLVHEQAKFKIDLIDTKNKIAFELKVSPKNVGHELYKDVMKVLLFNDNCTEEKDKIKTFVFITHKSAPELTDAWHLHLKSFLENQGIKFLFENY